MRKKKNEMRPLADWSNTGTNSNDWITASWARTAKQNMDKIPGFAPEEQEQNREQKPER